MPWGHKVAHTSRKHTKRSEIYICWFFRAQPKIARWTMRAELSSNVVEPLPTGGRISPYTICLATQPHWRLEEIRLQNVGWVARRMGRKSFQIYWEEILLQQHDKCKPMGKTDWRREWQGASFSSAGEAHGIKKTVLVEGRENYALERRGFGDN